MKNIFTFLLLVFIGGQFLWGQPANLVWNTQSPVSYTHLIWTNAIFRLPGDDLLPAGWMGPCEFFKTKE